MNKITDWTRINRYEEKYICRATAMAAMADDVESGKIGRKYQEDLSVREYVRQFAIDIENSCIKMIFG